MSCCSRPIYCSLDTFHCKHLTFMASRHKLNNPHNAWTNLFKSLKYGFGINAKKKRQLSDTKKLITFKKENLYESSLLGGFEYKTRLRECPKWAYRSEVGTNRHECSSINQHHFILTPTPQSISQHAIGYRRTDRLTKQPKLTVHSSLCRNPLEKPHFVKSINHRLKTGKIL